VSTGATSLDASVAFVGSVESIVIGAEGIAIGKITNK